LDGKWLVTAGKVGARLWRSTSGNPRWRLLADLPGHADIVTDIEFSDDSRWLLTHSAPEFVHVTILWDCSAPAPVERSVHLAQDPYGEFLGRFSPDSRWLVTGGGLDAGIRLWNLRSKDAGQRFESLPHEGLQPRGGMIIRSPRIVFRHDSKVLA